MSAWDISDVRRSLGVLRDGFSSAHVSFPKLSSVLVQAPNPYHHAFIEVPPLKDQDNSPSRKMDRDTRYFHGHVTDMVPDGSPAWTAYYFFESEEAMDHFRALAGPAANGFVKLLPEILAQATSNGGTGSENNWPFNELERISDSLIERYPTVLWLVVVHSLGWKRWELLIRAQRRIWDHRWGLPRNFSLPFDQDEFQRELAAYAPELQERFKDRQRPDYFFSELRGNVFEASVHAVELILRLYERENTSQTTNTPPTGATPAIQLATTVPIADPQQGSNPTETEVSAQELHSLCELKNELDPKNEYIGHSFPILKVLGRISLFNKDIDEPVLILGPTGSGKSEIADLIHKWSERRAKPYKREQASDNKPSDMTILKGRWIGFGSEHGLAGISRDKGATGILQDCDGGTVFVDEAADLSMDAQGFLLDVLDRKPIPPTAGKGAPFRPDVRLIFATNADLDEAVRGGKFRRDLLRRIRVRTIDIPPLSDRKDDIFEIVRKICENCDPTFQFWLSLLRYTWPGNVGELIAVLKLARSKRTQGRLDLDSLEWV